MKENQGSPLLKEDDIAAWCGHTRRSNIEQWLRDNHICYIYGKGNKIITTQAAIDKALIGESESITGEASF